MDHGSYDQHQAYCEQVSSPENHLLKELERITYLKCTRPRMISGSYLGRSLSMLSKLIKPERILEIGTFTGYSALCLAEGLEKNGELITIDQDDELRSIQEEFFSKSNFRNQIVSITGNALDILKDMKGKFDLIFLDADKENYTKYLPLIIRLSRVGTYILIDNMLWEGKVLDPDKNDTQTDSIRQLTSLVQNDARLSQLLLPIRDGLMLISVDSI